ncbi:hypothetical protein BDD12DRAFT_914801 [Trichophaea hybrida]|nr:hypothetical protein BDD12DRAFT_914801 [Trichophaea hybrida]
MANIWEKESVEEAMCDILLVLVDVEEWSVLVRVEELQAVVELQLQQEARSDEEEMCNILSVSVGIEESFESVAIGMHQDANTIMSFTQLEALRLTPPWMGQQYEYAFRHADSRALVYTRRSLEQLCAAFGGRDNDSHNLKMSCEYERTEILLRALPNGSGGRRSPNSACIHLSRARSTMQAPHLGHCKDHRCRGPDNVRVSCSCRSGDDHHKSISTDSPTPVTSAASVAASISTTSTAPTAPPTSPALNFSGSSFFGFDSLQYSLGFHDSGSHGSLDFYGSRSNGPVISPSPAPTSSSAFSISTVPTIPTVTASAKTLTTPTAPTMFLATATSPPAPSPPVSMDSSPADAPPTRHKPVQLYHENDPVPPYHQKPPRDSEQQEPCYYCADDHNSRKCANLHGSGESEIPMEPAIRDYCTMRDCVQAEAWLLLPPSPPSPPPARSVLSPSPPPPPPAQSPPPLRTSTPLLSPEQLTQAGASGYGALRTASTKTNCPPTTRSTKIPNA